MLALLRSLCRPVLLPHWWQDALLLLLLPGCVQPATDKTVVYLLDVSGLPPRTPWACAATTSP